MSNYGNYYYNIIPFDLKSTCATYQRLVDAIFAHLIGQNLEVYVENMIIKIREGHSYADYLEDILQLVRRCDMCLNLVNCSFGVLAGKFMVLCLQWDKLKPIHTSFRRSLIWGSPLTWRKHNKLQDVLPPCLASSPVQVIKLSFSSLPWEKKGSLNGPPSVMRLSPRLKSSSRPPDPHSSKGGLAFSLLPLDHQAGNELNPHSRDIQSREACIFHKQSVHGRWDMILEDWKTSVSHCYCDEKTQTILREARHPSKNQLSRPTSVEETRPGRKNGILVNRALGIRHLSWLVELLEYDIHPGQ